MMLRRSKTTDSDLMNKVFVALTLSREEYIHLYIYSGTVALRSIDLIVFCKIKMEKMPPPGAEPGRRSEHYSN